MALIYLFDQIGAVSLQQGSLTRDGSQRALCPGEGSPGGEQVSEPTCLSEGNKAESNLILLLFHYPVDHAELLISAVLGHTWKGQITEQVY